MKKFLEKICEDALGLNEAFVVKSIKKFGPFESILDVGCWNGEKTLDYAKSCGAKKIYGIEVVKEMSYEARRKGIC